MNEFVARLVTLAQSVVELPSPQPPKIFKSEKAIEPFAVMIKLHRVAVRDGLIAWVAPAPDNSILTEKDMESAILIMKAIVACEVRGLRVDFSDDYMEDATIPAPSVPSLMALFSSRQPPPAIIQAANKNTADARAMGEMKALMLKGAEIGLDAWLAPLGPEDAAAHRSVVLAWINGMIDMLLPVLDTVMQQTIDNRLRNYAELNEATITFGEWARRNLDAVGGLTPHTQAIVTAYNKFCDQIATLIDRSATAYMDSSELRSELVTLIGNNKTEMSTAIQQYSEHSKKISDGLREWQEKKAAADNAGQQIAMYIKQQ